MECVYREIARLWCALRTVHVTVSVWKSDAQFAVAFRMQWITNPPPVWHDTDSSCG